MATATKNVINANIILYGTRSAGKTSNLQFIHRKVKQSQRGQIVQMQQEGYPHVSYEFLPMELGELNGYDTNLYIYTAPAHVDGSETRHNLLNEAAGVVFIVDSSEARLDDNIECLTTLKDELRFWEIDYDSFPIVFQYNKRDAIDALSVDELETQLNPEGKPFYEARANDSEGVRDTFARICKMAVKKVRGKLVAEELENSVSAPPAPIGVTVPPSRGGATPSAADRTVEKTDGAGKKSSKGAKAAEKEPNISSATLSTTTGSKGKPAPAPVASSEQTVNEAPPPRYDEDEYGSVTATSDDIMVDDSDRPEDLDEGATGRIAAQAAPTAAESAAAAVATQTEAAATAASREDFLKTAISYGEQDDEPMMMGTLEAEDADDVEAFAGEDDDSVDATTSELRAGVPESLSSVSLPEAPALAAISLAQLSSDELNIQTYVEDEDDDTGPVINLGMRAYVTEEMELEDEMLLDEEPLTDDDADEGDAESLGDESVESDEGVAEAADDDSIEEGQEQALDDAAVSPLAEAAGQAGAAAVRTEAEEEDDERSIIATAEDLAAEGIVPRETSALPVVGLGSVASLSTRDMDFGATPVTIDESEDEVFHSERLTVEAPVDAPAAAEATGEEVLPEGAAEELADSALPDMAISPLEEESRGSEFEMVAEEAVFETVVDEESVLASGDATGGTEESNADKAGAQPTITGWGQVQRLDGGTLVLPVSIRLPGTTQDLELAVTLKVDLLLDALAGQSSSGGSKSR